MGEFRVGIKALITYNRKILLIKKVSSEGGFWEFPGGLMEFGEDLHSALKREILEETGLDNICIGKLVYVMTAKVSSERQIVGIGYLAYANSGIITLADDEHTDYIWADKKQMLELINTSMLNCVKENYDINLLEID